MMLNNLFAYYQNKIL